MPRKSLLAGSSIASFAALHFDPREIDAAIEMHGNSCEYRRGQQCPCARIETRMGAANCPVCHGIGWAYPKEMRCQTKFLDSSKSGSSTIEPAGAIVTGQAQVTFRIGIVPGRGDLVLPACEEHVVHEMFHRAVQQVDPREMRSRLDHRGRTRALPVRAERILYPDVYEMESLAWIADGKVVLGTQGVDYQLMKRDGGLWVEFVGDRGPAQGEGYSVRYIAPAAYMIKGSVPLFRHEADVAMPYKASLERLDRLAEDDLA